MVTGREPVGCSEVPVKRTAALRFRTRANKPVSRTLQPRRSDGAMSRMWIS